MHGRRVRDAAPPQRRLQREVRFPLHARGARAARRRALQGRDHRDLRAPPRQNPIQILFAPEILLMDLLQPNIMWK